jgi:hypothetical protein
MPIGANPKREREFKELEDKFKKARRYPGREEEVAARIVNKQRAEYGETKEERQKDEEGSAPERGLPIKYYQQLTVEQIRRQLGKLSTAERRQIKTYELANKRRKGVLEELE